MSEQDAEIEVDGLGRTSGDRLVDTVTSAVQAGHLRAFAELCETLADHPTPRTPWGRWFASYAFHVAANVARDLAGQVEESELSLETVREYVRGHGLAR